MYQYDFHVSSRAFFFRRLKRIINIVSNSSMWLASFLNFLNFAFMQQRTPFFRYSEASLSFLFFYIFLLFQNISEFDP